MSGHSLLKLQEECICSYFVQLVDTIQPQAVADALYQLRVLSPDQHEELTLAGQPRRERVRKLLGVLPTRGHGLHGLVLALVRSPEHALLAQSLWSSYRDKVQEYGIEDYSDKFEPGVVETAKGLSESLDSGSVAEDDGPLDTLDGVVEQQVRVCVQRYQHMQASLPAVVHQHLKVTSSIRSAYATDTQHQQPPFNGSSYNSESQHQYLSFNEPGHTSVGQHHMSYVGPSQKPTQLTAESVPVHPYEHLKPEVTNLPPPPPYPGMPSSMFHGPGSDTVSSSDDESGCDTDVNVSDDNSHVAISSVNSHEEGSCGAFLAVNLGNDRVMCIDPLPPPSGTYEDSRQRQWLTFVYNSLVQRINNGQYADYYCLSRHYVLANPHDNDLKFVLLTAEAATCLFRNQSQESKDLLEQAAGIVSGTSNPSARLLDILSKKAWLHQQDHSLGQLDTDTHVAMQLINADPGGCPGIAAGWIYLNRSRYISAMASGCPPEKVKRLSIQAVSHLERAIEHFQQESGEAAEVGVLTSLTAMAATLLGCGERLGTIHYKPPPEDVKKARDLISQVQDSTSSTPGALEAYVQLALCDYFLRLGHNHRHKAQQHAQMASNMALQCCLHEAEMLAQIRLMYIRSTATQNLAKTITTTPEGENTSKLSEVKPIRRRSKSLRTEKSDSSKSSQPKKSTFSWSCGKIAVCSRSVKMEIDLASCVRSIQPGVKLALLCVLVGVLAYTMHKYSIWCP